MLSASLRRHVGHGAFEHFQQCLLHPFSGDVPGDGGVFALAGDLVDFIDVDDAPLGLFHILIRFLQQPQQNVFHVFSDVARLGKGGGVGHRKGHIEHFGQGLGQERFAAAGGADQQDVALVQLGGCLVGFALAIALPGQAFVVVINSYGKIFLGFVLAHHLAVEKGLDLLGLGHLRQSWSGFGCFFAGGLTAAGVGGMAAAPASAGCAAMAVYQLLIKDLVAEIDTFIADVDTRAGDQLAHLFLRLAAERALQVGVELGHGQGSPDSRIDRK